MTYGTLVPFQPNWCQFYILHLQTYSRYSINITAIGLPADILQVQQHSIHVGKCVYMYQLGGENRYLINYYYLTQQFQLNYLFIPKALTLALISVEIVLHRLPDFVASYAVSLIKKLIIHNSLFYVACYKDQIVMRPKIYH